MRLGPLAVPDQKVLLLVWWLHCSPRQRDRELVRVSLPGPALESLVHGCLLGTLSLVPLTCWSTRIVFLRVAVWLSVCPETIFLRRLVLCIGVLWISPGAGLSPRGRPGPEPLDVGPQTWPAHASGWCRRQPAPYPALLSSSLAMAETDSLV